MRLSFHRPPLVALLVVFGVLVLDQATKAIVLAAEDRLPVTVVGGIRIELVFNSGVSFSLLTGRGWLVLLGVGLVSVAVLVLLFLTPRGFAVPLALILGGSVGNIIDRVRFDYSVVDFVAVYWYPRFNVADVAIIVGACLMVLAVLRRPADPKIEGGEGEPQDGEGEPGAPS